MDISRLRRGQLIAGVAGLALFIIMFFSWFGIDREGAEGLSSEEQIELAEEFADNVGDVSGDSVGFNAWESFGFIDIVLLLTVLVAVGLAAAAAMSRTVGLPVAASALTAGLGILSTVLILYRVIDPVNVLDRKFGLFLGLIAAAGVAYGGWQSMQEEGTTFGGEADRLQDRLGGDDAGGAPPPPPPPPTAPPPSNP